MRDGNDGYYGYEDGFDIAAAAADGGGGGGGGGGGAGGRRRPVICHRCNVAGHTVGTCSETRLTMDLAAVGKAALRAPDVDALRTALQRSADGMLEMLQGIANTVDGRPDAFQALSRDEKEAVIYIWRVLLSEDAKGGAAVFERDLAEAQRHDQAFEARQTAALLAHARVIGATTTGAAKYGAVLRALAPQIIVIEEAAEVLEAHVIAALSPHTQHLILIGDHQQLRPVVQEYGLQERHNLEVSLFERLVAAGAPKVTLLAQRRMHPDIRALIAPRIIYERLDDAGAVAGYPAVPGLARRLAFISHDKPERESGGSRANKHEAIFAAHLARHLLYNGVRPENIVMLAMYQGQISALRDAVQGIARSAPGSLAEVRIKTVDNFQGEEADVVILSLVRSNATRTIGFVGVPNRLCVALSRAKHGMYVLGNISLFREVSQLWAAVCSRVSPDCIAPKLQLDCARHDRERGRQPRSVSCGEDFDRLARMGGCPLPCGSRRGCGHSCEGLRWLQRFASSPCLLLLLTPPPLFLLRRRRRPDLPRQALRGRAALPQAVHRAAAGGLPAPVRRAVRQAAVPALRRQVRRTARLRPLV